MFEIFTLNKISEIGLKHLSPNEFKITLEQNAPDGIIVRSANMLEMDIPKSVKAIARAGAGTNNVPVDKCAEAGIVVFNTPGANANAVKELMIAGVLLSSRKIVDGINWVQTLVGDDVAKQVESGKGQFGGPEIAGKKMGIVGLGAIGTLCANAAHAMGMDVYVHNRTMNDEKKAKLADGITIVETTDEIYKTCDYISVNISYNKETKGVINKDVFAKCKKGVRFLNFARAELVNTADLLQAIDDGIVACYVTDFPTFEVLNNKNIITIPHLGASTPESEENCAEMAAIQIREFLQKGNIVNSVNFPNCELPKKDGKRVCVISKSDVSLGGLTEAVEKNGLKIVEMLNKAKGNFAYTIIDTENFSSVEEIEQEILKLEGVISVRII